MQKIDAHQHFWHYHPVSHSWINDAMAVLKNDFMPSDIEPILKKNGIDGCISVQAEQSEAETEFLLSLANQHSFIKGVVGWVDLASDNIEDRLAYYSQFSKIKGFRHILQDEKDRAFMLTPAFKNGISKLKKFDFSYDILIHEDQLKYTLDFVQAFPDQRFVIDHIAKPQIKNQKIVDWKSQLAAIAKHENVCCKVSGMVTEADWTEWVISDFKPYLDVVFESFGTKRVMYGSDWPVCLLAANYEQMKEVADNYIQQLSENEQRLFYADNAINFYQLQ